MTSMSESVTVPEKAKQTESAPTEWAWVDRAVWTARMLAALGNGVKGNKWFSLIDKVYRLSTLQAAYPDTDFHCANVAPSRAHSPRQSRGITYWIYGIAKHELWLRSV